MSTTKTMKSFDIKKILVPVDFSGTGEKVLEQAALMAKKTNAEITLINVLEGPLGNAGPDLFGISVPNRVKYESAIKEWTQQHLEAFKKKLIKTGAKKIEFIIETGSPYKKILATAEKIKPDIIVMGTHGVSGVKEFVAGSNTFRVVSQAECPVLSIQKHIPQSGFTEILLPFRDKAHSREKVDYAINIAKIYGAAIHILGISYDPDASALKKIQLETDQIERILEKQGIKHTSEVIEGNYTTKLIFEHAKKKKVDLIVAMSDIDKIGISDFITGPFIQQMINHSPIPVLSIHPLYNPDIVVDALVNADDWSFWA
jgi:nucleotide-binding universal stress UspA family protein